MAELNEKAAAAKSNGRVRSTKKILRVDLTAMVDLAFLLITFFILTTTLQKPRSMDLAMPDDGPAKGEAAASRTMTVLIGAKDKLSWYIGETAKPIIAPTVESFYGAGIRKALIEQSARIKKEQGKEMIVLIKPSDKSNYENMVTLMDELNITNNAIRAIVDITPGDIAMLKKDNIYN